MGADSSPEFSLRASRRSSIAASAEGQNPPSRRMTGAALYAAYMDAYHRRLRKAQPVYGDDAAGLTNNQRFNARRTPLKGKGTPPPDNYTPEYKPSKRFIQGRSYAAEPELLVHHTEAPHPLSVSMDTGMLLATLREAGAGARPASAYGNRPCLKMTEQSLRGSLQGSGLSIIAEQTENRPIRKPGDCAPAIKLVNTKARVLVLSEDVAPPATPTGSRSPGSAGKYITSMEPTCGSFNSPRDHMLNTAWAKHTYEAGLSPTSPLSRPATAPPGGRHASDPAAFITEARKRYLDMHTLGNTDVLTYRHSHGICPDEYKLDDTRAPAPHLVKPAADSARDVYYDARVGYAHNRVRALISMPKYG